jgi:hypothetical protein
MLGRFSRSPPALTLHQTLYATRNEPESLEPILRGGVQREGTNCRMHTHRGQWQLLRFWTTCARGLQKGEEHLEE